MRTLEQGITTYRGKMFDFTDPSACDLDILDLAVPLSNICRFAGQVPLGRWYSVAQHAVNVSRIVPGHQAFDGLMHDTAEAFTNDIVKPLKLLAGSVFSDVEQRIEQAMSRKFGFGYPLSPEVKLADNQMLALEMAYVCGWDPDEYDFLRDTGWREMLPLVDLNGWTPDRACSRFMDRYNEIRGGIDARGGGR